MGEASLTISQVEEARAHLQRLKRALVRKGISCRQMVEGVEVVEEGPAASSTSPFHLFPALPTAAASAPSRAQDELASLFEMAKAGGHIVETVRTRWRGGGWGTKMFTTLAETLK